MELRKGARDEFNSLLEQLIVPTLVKATHRGEREIRLGKGMKIFYRSLMSATRRNYYFI